MLFERLASRVLGTATVRSVPAPTPRREPLGQAALWRPRDLGRFARLLVRVAGAGGLGLVRQVLRAQEYWRLKGLSADRRWSSTSIRAGYLDEIQRAARSAPRQRTLAEWQHRPGGAYLLARRPDGRARARLVLTAGLSRAGDGPEATCGCSSVALPRLLVSSTLRARPCARSRQPPSACLDGAMPSDIR